MTVLFYEVDAQIGGKLAQLGARLIDSTAKKLAGDSSSRSEKLSAGLQRIQRKRRRRAGWAS